jgi:hypothetical protein
MKIPETYEEYLKTPKEILKQIIESDNLTNDQILILYNFNKEAMHEQKNLISENISESKNILWEDLRG